MCIQASFTLSYVLQCSRKINYYPHCLYTTKTQVGKDFAWMTQSGTESKEGNPGLPSHKLAPQHKTLL